MVCPVGATEDLLAPLRDQLADAAVLLDYDGTLAPIVPDPVDAVPLPGVVEALVALHARGALVAVLSGRPVSFLDEHVPSEIAAFGLYGLERRVGGVVHADPAAEAWRSVIDEVAARAAAALPAEVVEHKGLSLTLHVRRHPELADQARGFAAEAAASAGLEVRPAKQSAELHPPVAVDKGTLVDELVVGRRAACFIGDDVGDLPAFAALDRFAASGGHAVRVLVRTEETAPELEGRADVEVAGPEGVLTVLRSLLA
jgi:trehalose 6-phosphate phosphatase